MAAERWAPYRELLSSVQDIVLQRNDRFHHFKSLLQKHKPDFLNILRNPVSNIDVNLSLGYDVKVVYFQNFMDELPATLSRLSIFTMSNFMLF